VLPTFAYGPSRCGASIRAAQSRSAHTVPGVDDAGGGRRGRRAGVSAERWEVLVARWAIPRQHGRDLGGSLNLNLLVSRGMSGCLCGCTGRRSARPG